MAQCNAAHISPEAHAAIAAFRDAEPTTQSRLEQCASGRELIERYAWHDDIATAAAIDVDHCVPSLVGREYGDITQSTSPRRSDRTT